jgi:tRNA threonylcarbamoyladenosine biosynthesis protein TsaE
LSFLEKKLTNSKLNQFNERKQYNNKKTFYTSSAEETFGVGKNIGKKLKGGEVILLIGELGTGKTIFVKGLAQGLGVKSNAEITSPTFTIIHQHYGRLPLYHIDLFRITCAEELYNLGLEEIMSGANIVAIEWAEKLGALTPKRCIKIFFQHLGGNKRSLFISIPYDSLAILS